MTAKAWLGILLKQPLAHARGSDPSRNSDLSRDRQGAIARLLVALCLIAAALLGATPPAGEWPQFRGNPQLTGVATGPVPANLKLLWTYDAGESIESSAAIAGGTAYVGSQSKDLLAIDLATGKLRWKYRATDSIGESSPAVADGTVYIDRKSVV